MRRYTTLCNIYVRINDKSQGSVATWFMNGEILY